MFLWDETHESCIPCIGCAAQHQSRRKLHGSDEDSTLDPHKRIPMRLAHKRPNSISTEPPGTCECTWQVTSPHASVKLPTAKHAKLNQPKPVPMSYTIPIHNADRYLHCTPLTRAGPLTWGTCRALHTMAHKPGHRSATEGGRASHSKINCLLVRIAVAIDIRTRAWAGYQQYTKEQTAEIHAMHPECYLILIDHQCFITADRYRSRTANNKTWSRVTLYTAGQLAHSPAT